MIAAALSGLFLLVLIFGGLALSNWDRCKAAYRDIRRELP